MNLIQLIIAVGEMFCDGGIIGCQLACLLELGNRLLILSQLIIDPPKAVGDISRVGFQCHGFLNHPEGLLKVDPLFGIRVTQIVEGIGRVGF